MSFIILYIAIKLLNVKKGWFNVKIISGMLYIAILT